MKNQIIQNVFKLMLGTSALLVSVAFFIRTISPVQANNSDNPTSTSLDANTASPDDLVVGCGSGIYQWDSYMKRWDKVGPQ
jgi:hypothetical protein